MAVTLTKNAALRVKDFIKSRGYGYGLRVAITTTGCSGLTYKLEFVDETKDEDVVFSSNDINIVVDKKSLVYLDGTELDYVKEGINEGFEFNNPQVKNKCGCGESFNV